MSAGSENFNLIAEVGRIHDLKILEVRPLSGGSISEVFLLRTSSGNKVLKVNKASQFPGMFLAEKIGLETLESTKTFKIPAVFSQGDLEGNSYLLLEHLQEAFPIDSFWKQFAKNLSTLHRTSAPKFGFPSSNYIGSLPQYNEQKATAAEFYISQRLEPQLRLASEKGYEFRSLETAYKNISSEIPEEPPALIHGDLWSGNYMVTIKGYPALIDPAVCYGSREMDLSMMKLFGGFPEEVFTCYSEYFPLEPGFSDRVSLWQLYYLLVHLNIFGSSYLTPVSKILQNYSR